MNQTRTRRKLQRLRIEKTATEKIPAGIARTKKIIRTERIKEIQFMKLCSQIRIEDYRKERAERQKTERKAKRKKISPSYLEYPA